MSSFETWPTWGARPLGTMYTAKVAVIARTSSTEATNDLPRSWRVNGAAWAGRCVSMSGDPRGLRSASAAGRPTSVLGRSGSRSRGRTRGGPCVRRLVGGEIGGCKPPGDELAHPAPVRSAARAWREPAHDPAEVPCRGCSGGRNGLVDECLQPRFGELLRQELGEDRDLGLLLRGEVLASAASERLDGLAPRLHLAREHADELVVGQGLLVALLQVVRGALGEPERVASQRVTRPHRGGQLLVEALLEGHRSGT